MKLYIGTRLGGEIPAWANGVVHKVEGYVKCNPPMYGHEQPHIIELYFEPCKVWRSRCNISLWHGDINCTVYVGTDGQGVEFALAHELAHALAPIESAQYNLWAKLPHDIQPCEIYADVVAEVVTGINREDWADSNGLD